jgi:type I restriction enzyme S subunit
VSHFRPYPKYKDSGIAWLSEVPEGWDVIRLKNLLAKRITDGPHTTPVFTSDGVPFLSVDGIQNGELQFDGCRYISEADHAEFRKKALPVKDDILMGKAASTGKIARVKVDFEFSIWSPLALLRLDKGAVNPCFIEQSLKSSLSQAQIDNYCNANTQKNISMDDIPRLVLLRPPLEEQETIADFLDRETARIDLLISKKTRFIELLKEKRQALITQAVTKGLDDSVPMKDSGVKWLGQVPAHWQVRRMASIFREAIRTGDPALPILSISIHDGISDDEIAPEDRDRRVLQIEDRTKYKRVAPNDLAYNMMRAWQGAFGAVTVDGLVSPAYVVAEPTSEFRTTYIENLLRTPMAVEEMRRFSRGIADFRMRLYWDYFRDLRVCLPPQAEQDKILEMITSETSRIDRLAEKTERSIDLLKEHRAALITAAVTGKIDVREAA